jgi:hypothetical protein
MEQGTKHESIGRNWFTRAMLKAIGKDYIVSDEAYKIFALVLEIQISWAAKYRHPLWKNHADFASS